MAQGWGGGKYTPKQRELAFWKKVRKDKDGCWLWTGAEYTSGYGSFWNGSKCVGAHVFSYELENGFVDKYKYVCHTCDNRKCVNPLHLFLGSPKENQRDMYSKGRGHKARGSKQGKAKLTEADIPKILADSRAIRKIARDYGVGSTSIWLIKNGVTWRHVEKDVRGSRLVCEPDQSK